MLDLLGPAPNHRLEHALDAATAGLVIAAVYSARTVDGVEAGDELAVTVDAPPQASRHGGDETALLDRPPVAMQV